MVLTLRTPGPVGVIWGRRLNMRLGTQALSSVGQRCGPNTGPGPGCTGLGLHGNPQCGRDGRNPNQSTPCERLDPAVFQEFL